MLHRALFPDAPSHEELSIKGAKVLLVDDEPRLCDSFCTFLDLVGLVHHICTSGLDAIDILGREDFDVILLDLGLPDISGHEVLGKIREMEVRAPVIIVSGESTIDAAIKALRKGVFDFVRKPYEPEQLLQVVKNAIYKTRLENANRLIHDKFEQSKDLYRYLVDSSPDLIYILDDNENFSFINQRVEDVLGFTPDQLIGKHYSYLVYEEDYDRAKFIFNERRTDNRTEQNVELRLKCRTGDKRFRHFDATYITIVLKSRGVYDGSGKGAPFIGTYGVARDISDRKRAEELINHQAYHDALTDLPNRTLFKDRLGLAITQAQRAEEKLAVMFIDLDRFKLVNDTLGHMRGDELLVSVAGRLKKCLRKGDTLARIGGDEFNILLTSFKSNQDVKTTAQKILAQLNKPFLLDGKEVFISASIGISIYPEHGDSLDLLVKSADIAMYHVKWEGKNGYMFYDSSMNAVFHRKLAMETELRRAIESNQFVLNFQPQVHIPSRSIIGMESLVRWIHPEQGVISPAEFIPLAEETGLITKITEWVLNESCKHYKRWREMGIENVRMSLNFSPQDIEREDFVPMIRKTLDNYGLPDDLLEIEITEGTIMRDMINSVNKLKELGSYGIKVAVDDFGTCYSSLAYLKKFPIHTIKIDKAFVHDIQGMKEEQPIVSAIVAIAQGFRMGVIAEGVETLEQNLVLTALGCSVMQGFLFSRPLTAEEATNALLNHEKLFAVLDDSEHQSPWLNFKALS